jgi:cilia- and flagella-associated protein 65
MHAEHGMILRSGLQCPEQVEFKDWQLGGEYIKSILVKNVSVKTIKFKYKQPASKAFSMDFPELIKLSAGMNCTLKVWFPRARLF